MHIQRVDREVETENIMVYIHILVSVGFEVGIPDMRSMTKMLAGVWAGITHCTREKKNT